MPALPPQPGDVRVLRLHLRGPAAALQRSRQTLAAGWPSAAWPITGDDELLLLRRLRVQGPAASLGETAAAQARALAARAQGPWGPGAEQAEALRFASQAEYVAWQLHRLLRGSAAPSADAVATLLCQVPLALPTVWLLLHRAAPGSGAALWQTLWRSLDEAGAQRVLSTVAVATGWGRSLAGANHAEAGLAQPGADEPSPLAVAPPMLAAARPALRGLPAGDARVRLAVLLWLWQTSPAQLHSGRAAPLLQQLARQLVAPATPARPPVMVVRHAAANLAKPVQVALAPQAGGVADAPPGAEARHADVEVRLTSGTARPGLGSPPHAPHPQPNPALTAPFTEAAAQPATSPALPPSHTVAEAGTDSFFTSHGGLFFLLQVLGGPLCQRRLQDLHEPQAGWREWLRLVNALGATPDAAWLAFATQAAQLETPQQASALQWPATTASALLQAAEARYGSEALQAAIAPRPARVRATPTQVDVHFRLADAALAVRRVGLDSDPGWVPWLGRVLRWHYGSALAPQPHEVPSLPPTPGPP